MAEVNSFPLTTTPLATALQSINFLLYRTTSTTSLAIGTGAKVFTVEADKDFQPGDFVIAVSDADQANYMFGSVVSYSGTTLTTTITAIGGSGTLADWSVRLSGPSGSAGVAGSTGPAAWSAPTAWLTATDYTIGPPASVVTEGGETYVALISHTSGTFATDLAASRWIKIAERGADGAGAGDMLKADNLSGLANYATARSNMGLGTGDSPQFTAVNIGHASDTTLARSSAGNLSIEGNVIYRAGGTDVAIADGGTGASTVAGAQANFGYPVILGGFVAVDFNTTNTDHPITIASPTTNYRILTYTIFNNGATASLTTATGGIFTAAGGGGLAIKTDGALAAITTNAINAAGNAIIAGVNTIVSGTTLYYRNGTAQGAAASGVVYINIQPLP